MWKNFQVFQMNYSSVFPFFEHNDITSRLQKTKGNLTENFNPEILFDFNGEIAPEREYQVNIEVESWTKSEIKESDFEDILKLCK